MIWNNFVFNKTYFHYITFFHDIKIYFHSIKTNLYSIKYIFIISPFFPWYQNIFSFSQNKSVFSKKYFYHKYFFHSSKICFYYMNFLLNTILVSISDVPLVFTKIRILLPVCKLNNSTRMWIFINCLNLSSRRSLWYRNQSIDLQSKSKEWCLYDRDLRDERFKHGVVS